MTADQIVGALMLTAAVYFLAGLALDQLRRTRRVSSSPRPEVDHALTQAQEEARPDAPAPVCELWPASVTRAEVARRAQARRDERRASDARERRASAREVQPPSGREAGRRGLERTPTQTPALELRRDAVVSGSIRYLGTGRRAPITPAHSKRIDGMPGQTRVFENAPVPPPAGSTEFSLEKWEARPIASKQDEVAL